MAVRCSNGLNVTQYRAGVEVASLNPTNLDGGTGDLTFSTGPLDYPQSHRNTRVTITDTEQGAILGRISQVSWSPDSQVDFTAETMMQRLNIEATILPSFGLSLSASMNQVLALVGMTSNGLPTSGTVVFPGWRGAVLDYIKHFCLVYGYEFHTSSTVYPDIVYFRSIRTQEFPRSFFSSKSFSVTDQSVAQSVSVNMYEYRTPSATYMEFTPASVDDPQILTVDAGEVIEYDIKCNGWVSAVNQPVPMDLVGPEERTDTGAYCVAGNDGLPVMAAQWTAQGGSVRVDISDDPSVLHVTITAPDADTLPNTAGGDTLAPYSIAATAVDENAFYNSLHITGVGVRFTKSTQVFLTGADASVSSEENPTNVDNPFVNTTARLWNIGVRAAQALAGPNYTINATAKMLADSFTSVLGSRYEQSGVVFRMESATMEPSGWTITGNADTLVSDFNTAWAGKTIADFNTAQAGRTFDVFAAMPLRTA